MKGSRKGFSVLTARSRSYSNLPSSGKQEPVRTNRTYEDLTTYPLEVFFLLGSIWPSNASSYPHGRNE
ncbi:hypothetical protein TSUD_176970 [Trifolium subterraneum]|uniref:Uncharacterized protein n=1 Tax=Trifolium subterraneum TaxID=3900 RepID=A0A2Z6PJT9_TRISU|nr:hypothetical protein TSUD_176970 [Trifolium subterraneum]